MPGSDQSSLAGDFWLAAHDTNLGHARLAAQPLGIGLAAALLAELVFAHHVLVHNGALYPQLAPMPEDVALAPIVRLLNEEDREARRAAGLRQQQSGLDLQEWIQYLAFENRAEELITIRLSQRGMAVREERRKLFGGTVSRFVPRDSYLSGSPGNLILTSLQRRTPLSEMELTLAGLMLATGLSQHSLATATSGNYEDLADQLKSLHPMLRELLRAAEGIVGNAVMTR